MSSSILIPRCCHATLHCNQSTPQSSLHRPQACQWAAADTTLKGTFSAAEQTATSPIGVDTLSHTKSSICMLFQHIF